MAGLLIAAGIPATVRAQDLKYGALAVDRNNGFIYGFAVDFPTQEQAVAFAVNEVNRRGGHGTAVLAWSGNGYAVYRTVDSDVGTAYGWGIAPTFAEANKIALNEALKRSKGRPPSRLVWAANTQTATPAPLVKYKEVRPDPERMKEGRDTLVVAKPAAEPSTPAPPAPLPEPRREGNAAEARILLGDAHEQPRATTSARPQAGTVKDIDGNVYPVVEIGGKKWMAVNLRTTRFRDGSGIPFAAGGEGWKEVTTPRYCWPANNGSVAERQGALYNFHTVVDPRGLAPAGWHVATRQEWLELVNALGNGEVASAKLKSAEGGDWIAGGAGNNQSKFLAVQVDDLISGTFMVRHGFTYWWTPASGVDRYRDPIGRAFGVFQADEPRFEEVSQGSALSVRCVKDD